METVYEVRLPTEEREAMERRLIAMRLRDLQASDRTSRETIRQALDRTVTIYG